jgi:hypothetical protein
MFLETATEAFQPHVAPGSQILLAVLLIPTLGIGIYWQPLANLAALVF